MYYHFFNRAKVSNKNLRNMLCNADTIIYMRTETPDILYIKYKEDSWYIKELSDEKYVLYHNNYTILENHERYIKDGYHRQIHQELSVNQYFKYIEGYDWQVHLKKEEFVEEQVMVQQVEKQSV